MKKNNHGFAPIIILVLIALAVVGYFSYKNYWSKLQTLVLNSPIPTATADPTSDWKTYTNTKYGYTLKYPDEISIHTTLEALPGNEADRVLTQTNAIGFNRDNTPIGQLIVASTDKSLQELQTEMQSYNKRKIDFVKTTLSSEPALHGEADSGKFLFTIHNTFNYAFDISDDFMNQILSTFKFTN